MEKFGSPLFPCFSPLPSVSSSVQPFIQNREDVLDWRMKFCSKQPVPPGLLWRNDQAGVKEEEENEKDKAEEWSWKGREVLGGRHFLNNVTWTTKIRPDWARNGHSWAKISLVMANSWISRCKTEFRVQTWFFREVQLHPIQAPLNQQISWPGRLLSCLNLIYNSNLHLEGT